MRSYELTVRSIDGNAPIQPSDIRAVQAEIRDAYPGATNESVAVVPGESLGEIGGLDLTEIVAIQFYWEVED